MSTRPKVEILPGVVRSALDNVRITRRRFTTVALLSTAWFARPSLLRAAEKPGDQPTPTGVPTGPGPVQLQPLQLRIVRPDDLLVLDLEFENLHFEPGPPAQLVRTDAGQAARLIVHHQPQSVGEQAFLETEDQKPNVGWGIKRDGGPDPSYVPTDAALQVPAAALMGGRSRVAFTMPQGLQSLAYNLSSLLGACRTWPMNLDAAVRPLRADLIQPEIGEAPHRPNKKVTAIEVPYRLECWASSCPACKDWCRS